MTDIERQLSRMYEYFNIDESNTCNTCCNLKPTSKDNPELVCIAYGKKYCSSWLCDGKACGLYNINFNSKSCHYTAVGAIYATEDKAESKASPVSKDQLSLFT